MAKTIDIEPVRGVKNALRDLADFFASKQAQDLTDDDLDTTAKSLEEQAEALEAFTDKHSHKTGMALLRFLLCFAIYAAIFLVNFKFYNQYNLFNEEFYMKVAHKVFPDSTEYSAYAHYLQLGSCFFFAILNFFLSLLLMVFISIFVGIFRPRWWNGLAEAILAAVFSGVLLYLYYVYLFKERVFEQYM